jgi:hypothetical protein
MTFPQRWLQLGRVLPHLTSMSFVAYLHFTTVVNSQGGQGPKWQGEEQQWKPQFRLRLQTSLQVRCSALSLHKI